MPCHCKEVPNHRAPIFLISLFVKNNLWIQEGMSNIGTPSGNTSQREKEFIQDVTILRRNGG